jgi:hypothetical protein
MKYVKLYCFTLAGCHDHASQRATTANKAFSFLYGLSANSMASSTLTLKPVSALSHLGKIIPNENLFWEQVYDAKSCYLSHIVKAG